MIGYDIDGTLSDPAFAFPPGAVVISGRTIAEYDDFAKALAQRVPVYIRGSGAYGDRVAAAQFKTAMIVHLGVTEYYEDDPLQADLIEQHCDCTVHRV